MEFKILNHFSQLDEIDNLSHSKLQVIFKHSTRCSISNMAKRVLSGELNDNIKEKADVYYLDLINYRDISNNIATRYLVKHESPQILIISDGKCIYHASHDEVSLNKAFGKI